MDYSIDLQGYMSESEYENLKKNLKTFVEEAEDLSRDYSLRKESGLVKIGYDSCNDKERNLILSTVAYSLTESESVLQYRITGDAVQFGVISRSGVEELDLDKVLEARVREKKQEIQNENLKQGAEEVKQRLVRIEEKVRENNEVIHDYCKDVKHHVNSGEKGTFFLCDAQGSFYRDFSPTPMTARDFEAKCREQDLDIRVVHASSECKDLTHLEQDVCNRVREIVDAKKEERAQIVQEEKKEEKQSFHR